MNAPNRIINFIYDIHRDIGSRAAGSPDEENTAEYIKSVLNKYSDEILTESFSCHPKQLIYFLNFLFIGYSSALLIYLISPLICFLMMTFMAANLLLFRLYNKHVMLYLMPKVKSRNITAKIKPVRETEKILIFTGNIDSPFVARFKDYSLKNYPGLVIKYLSYFFIFVISFNLLKLFNVLNFLTDYLYLPAFIPVAVFMFQNVAVFFDKSFGAGNNLSGSAVILSLVKHFSENRLDNTELWFCLYGAGNNGTGFAGPNAFISKHLSEIKENTSVINLSDIAENNICLVTKEKQSFTRLNPELVKKVRLAATKLGLQVFPLEAEETTAATFFSWENIPAVTITSMDKKTLLRYDLKEDFPQYLSEDKLQRIYKICIETAILTDERKKNK